MTAFRPAVWIIHAAIAVMATLLLGCSGGTAGTPAQAGVPAPAEVLPDGFPIPADAQVLQAPGGVDGRGVVTLGVPGAPGDILAFYERELPPHDWELEAWKGTDPFGRPTDGFILQRGEETAALSVTAGDDDLVRVQLNFAQPELSKPGEGHGGGHGGGAPEQDAEESHS